MATIVYYACALCSISLLYSPYTKRAAFFLSELEAKPMPHCTGRGKKLHIHIIIEHSHNAAQFFSRSCHYYYYYDDEQENKKS